MRQQLRNPGVGAGLIGVIFAIELAAGFVTVTEARWETLGIWAALAAVLVTGFGLLLTRAHGEAVGQTQAQADAARYCSARASTTGTA